MCNARPKSSQPAGHWLRVPFGPDPDWFEAYWYGPHPTVVERFGSLIGFLVSVIRGAMSLPDEIRRVAERCPNNGER
jgi:hypothetical protein